ncbi:MAG: glycosyltransferase family 2 protein [Nannocystaceae bacterium]|nr:glycosyltransferase family 2 protein [Myxococcales bacterium]
MRISVLIPVFDEARSLGPLYEELVAVAAKVRLDLEFVFVDDGSRDGSHAILLQLAARDRRVKALRLRRNYGQTAALAAAIDHATGDVLVPIDADGQNDPRDIPRLVERLDEGFDVVSGWRRQRRDVLLSRRLPSWVANRLVSAWTGVRLHDHGCSLKAFRARFLRDLRLYGEMHRFLAVYAAWDGARVTELEVNHRPRVHGYSKYGIGRTARVVLDMLTFKLLCRYGTRPVHLFGGFGLLLIVAGLVIALAVAIELLIPGPFAHRGAALVLAATLACAGAIAVMLGMVAELVIRTYHEVGGRPIYELDESPGGPRPTASAARGYTRSD